MSRRTRVYFSHVEEDVQFFDELLTHLTPLERQQRIDLWHDGLIRPGDDRAALVERFLDQADIVIVLVSPDLVASKEHCETHLAPVIRRAREGSARIIPVLVRRANWKSSPLGGFQPLPKNGKPVNASRNRDDIWVEVTEEIQAVIERDQARVDYVAENHRLQEELDKEKGESQRLMARYAALMVNFNKSEQTYKESLAQERERSTNTTNRLLSDLRAGSEQATALKAQVSSLTQQLTSLTRQLGDAERVKGELAATIESLKKQRQADREEINKLRGELQHALEKVTRMENSRKIRAEILPDGIKIDPVPGLVNWAFRVRNTGEVGFRLVRAEINWCFAPSVMLNVVADLLRAAKPTESREPLLPAPEKLDFRDQPVIATGQTSDPFPIRFETASATAQQLLQLLGNRIQDRSPAGWSKAIRPILVLIVEGQALKLQKSFTLVFP